MTQENKKPLGRGKLPSGYHEIIYWRLTSKPVIALVLQLVSLPLFVIWLGIFFWLALKLGRFSANFTIKFGSDTVIALLGIFMTLILHELVHGAVAHIFGANPEYGVIWKQLMFYTTTPGYAFPRQQFLAICIAPFLLSHISHLMN